MYDWTVIVTPQKTLGGYASGFLTGFITTRNLDFANESGLKGLKSGLFIGGITGALSGYFSAKQSGVNPWTGKIKNSITIGEGMKSDIKQGWFGIDKISKDLGTNKFDPQSRDHHGLMSENQFWIDYYMDNGAVVFNRGTVGNNSQYYFMEQQHIEGYPNVYTVKYYYNKKQSLRIYWIRKR